MSSLLLLSGALAKNGSFGFAKGRLLCRAKPNVPFVRWLFCPLVFRLLSGQIGLHPTFWGFAMAGSFSTKLHSEN
ncbi:hypothetical protein SAMN03080617_04328 [Algoriphagus alkaliphilus]|uniref:Uncharacterized protein n=1 Tax=Algoriphagus alkaliphilus TaxID=279824 RepID=A0A1G5ZR24_9BACT|nr:hypothetical protein SAMN03080617_04328 [Algoriphagus alkaliphilus]